MTVGYRGLRKRQDWVATTIYTDGTTSQTGGLTAYALRKEGVVSHSGPVRDWKRKIRQNRSATSSLTGTLYEDFVYGGNLIVNMGYRYPTTILGWHVDYQNQLLQTAPSYYDWQSITSLGNGFYGIDAEAKSRYLSRAIEKQRSIMGGVALGELRETLELIKNPAKALWRRVNDWRTSAKKQRSRSLRKHWRLPKRKRKRAVKKELADKWLEYSFGYKPLLNDIDDATRALNRRHDWLSNGEHVSASFSNKSNTWTEISGDTSAYLAYVRTTRWSVDTRTIRYYGKTKAYVMNPLKFNARLWGFDPRDFVPTLWELLPYSFLIDYFTNIGDVLQAWSWGKAGLAWTNRGMKTERLYTVVQRPRPQNSQYYDLGSSQAGGYSVNHAKVERAAYTESLIPEFTWKIPGMSLRWLNMAALYAGRRSDARFRI